MTYSLLCTITNKTIRRGMTAEDAAFYCRMAPHLAAVAEGA